jgi:hypothetical protein
MIRKREIKYGSQLIEEQVDPFNNLGGTITWDGRRTTDLEWSMAHAKKAHVGKATSAFNEDETKNEDTECDNSRMQQGTLLVGDMGPWGSGSEERTRFRNSALEADAGDGRMKYETKRYAGGWKRDEAQDSPPS